MLVFRSSLVELKIIKRQNFAKRQALTRYIALGDDTNYQE